MSSQEDRAAKRRRIEDELLRPGIGSCHLHDDGLVALPAQPQYAAIEMTTAELLHIIEEANFGSVLCQRMQNVKDMCYDVLFSQAAE